MPNDRPRPPLVADPGLRYLLVMTRRALLQVCKAIEVVTAPQPGEGRNAA